MPQSGQVPGAFFRTSGCIGQTNQAAAGEGFGAGVAVGAGRGVVFGAGLGVAGDGASWW